MSAGFSVQPVEEMLPPGTETCWVAAPVGLDNPTLINIRNNDLMLSAHLSGNASFVFSYSTSPWPLNTIHAVMRWSYSKQWLRSSRRPDRQNTLFSHRKNRLLLVWHFREKNRPSSTTRLQYYRALKTSPLPFFLLQHTQRRN